MVNKKSFFVIAMALMLPLHQMSADPVSLDFQVRIIDPTEDEGRHRGPIQPPLVAVEDNTLYFYTPCDGLELRLVDGNGNVVFVTTIPSACATLDLPSGLEGTYELRIVFDNYYFYADITL